MGKYKLSEELAKNGKYKRQKRARENNAIKNNNCNVVQNKNTFSEVSQSSEDFDTDKTIKTVSYVEI